jgi:hypothetical protein
MNWKQEQGIARAHSFHPLRVGSKLLSGQRQVTPLTLRLDIGSERGTTPFYMLLEETLRSAPTSSMVARCKGTPARAPAGGTTQNSLVQSIGRVSQPHTCVFMLNLEHAMHFRLSFFRKDCQAFGFILVFAYCD